jgi:hypothetical protein
MKRFLIALTLVAALAACKREPGDELVGNWTGKIVVTEKDLVSAIMAGKASADVAADSKRAFDAMAGSLELRDDHTYSMRMGTEASNGVWEFKEGKITLRLANIDPVVGFVMTGTPSEDSDTITMVDPTGKGTSTVVFTRD